MQTKLITLTTGLVLAVAGFGSSAAAAPSNCPELRTPCQPTGDRPGGKRPGGKAIVPKLTAWQADSQGQIWRTGMKHIMY